MTREKLTGDERRIVRQVGLELVMHGDRPLRTFGDALDALEAEGPQGRREIIDRARTAVGLPDIATQEARRKFEAANSVRGWGPDSQGRRLTQCAAKGCDVMPTNPNGSLRPVADRRWWCPRHRDQAGPEDHLPPEPDYVIGRHMQLVAVGAEAERLRREDEKVQAAHREKVEARRQDDERLRRLEEEHRRGLRPPRGFGG
jgi:hypothetical protein